MRERVGTGLRKERGVTLRLWHASAGLHTEQERRRQTSDPGREESLHVRSLPNFEKKDQP
jgi:hypothetical protein